MHSPNARPDLGAVYEPAAQRIGDLTAGSRARLLESVVLNANDAVVITDAAPLDGPGSGPQIVYVNPAFTAMTGYSPEEVIGKSPRILHGPGTSSADRARMRAALCAWQPITLEVINYRKNGEAFSVDISLTPVADETGWFTHWISVQRDTTERRGAQEALVQARIVAEKQSAVSLEIKQRERVEARLAYSVVHDDLTGLHNRSYFTERLANAVARARRDGQYRYSLIHVDLDRFKHVNDRLGFRIGDRVLRELAARLERCARSTDTLARIGGDQFGLLIEEPADESDVCTVAARLLKEISAQPCSDAGDISIAASIGIVHADAGYSDPEAVMRDAGIALNHARHFASNTFVVFTEQMRDQADTALRIRNDLYGAVARGEMRLHYQPLADVALGRVYGFEALVRWQHPTMGLVAPLDFIPIAEATGLIIEIGRWVLFEGCRAATELAARAGYPLVMSINVSSQQLLRPDFLDDLRAALECAALEPGALQLEITESIFLSGANLVGALFAKIRALGVRIAFDDFGTGYSSLSYLERFQIDTLKIDQSFVARMSDVSARSEIVRMIIALAEALGVDVVAEGVESEVQRQALGDLGCTHLQGYLFSRPLTPGAALDVFGDGTSSGLSAGPLSESIAGQGSPRLSAAQRAELSGAVHAALEIHFALLDGLRAAVVKGRADFDHEPAARDDRCPLGRWLNDGISSALRGMPLYDVTRSRHAMFHRSMARLLTLVDSDPAAAAASLRRGGDVANCATSLVRALRNWAAIADVELSPASLALAHNIEAILATP